uniref:Plant antimicrobial peptide domain-containing protein n=1 Tax=Triticum urartu TaxID=4572 RepID=A0A8R7K381_TRIUA
MVLLAPATVSAEQEDGATTIATLQVEEEVGSRADDHGNDWCDIKCDYQQDPVKRQFCVDQCHSQEHHHPSREFCEMKCQHWQDPTRKEQCVQQCMSFGLNLHVGNNNGVDGRPHALEEEVGSRADDHGNDDCDIKCAYYQDLARRQFCVDQCHSQQHHHPSREDCRVEVSTLARPNKKGTMRAAVHELWPQPPCGWQQQRGRAPPRLGSGGRSHHRGGGVTSAVSHL